MSPSDALTVRQAKFVDLLTTPNQPAFCQPSLAYRTVHPSAQPNTSWTGASETMRNPKVQEAIRGQLSLAQLGNGLKLCLRESRKLLKTTRPSVKLSAIRETRETLMDYAKLTGKLVEKREITQLSTQDRDAVRAFVRQHLGYPQPVDSPSPSITTS